MLYNYYTMQQIASLQSFQSIEQRAKLINLVAKIDRILRLARMAKVNDPSTINQIKERCKAIIRQIQKTEGQKFAFLQEKINNYITSCIAELCEKKVPPVSVKQPSINGNAINSKQNSKISSFGNLEQKINQEKDSSSSMVQKSWQIEKSRQQEKEKDKKKQSLQNSNKTETKAQFNTLIKKQQSSIQIQLKNSQSISSNPPPITLKDYCMHNFNNIQTKIIINEDIVNYMKNQDPGKVGLLGVQKPRDLGNEKLFVCTYMEFLKEEITSANVSYQEHQIEVDQFLNVVRYPLILSVIGQTVSDMKIHFVKFLLSMTSPLPLVIIFNQTAPEKSIVIKMNEKVISNIENCTLLQLDSQTMKDKNKYKCTSFKQIAVGRDKLVATKQLQRKLKKQVKQNDQAITIQKLNKMDFKQPFSMKQPANKVEPKIQSQIEVKNAIKQNQKIQSISDISSASYQFKYILHTKFAAAAWADYFIYLVTDERELTSRKKQKSVEEMLDFVKNSTNECVIGCSLKTSDKRIPPLLFSIQLKQRKKCPMILIKLKNLTLNKLIFIRLKEEVSQEDVMNTVITYKDLQQNVPNFIQILLVGQKTETTKYQGKNPLKQI